MLILHFVISLKINLEMLDVFIDCIKITFVHSQFHKNTRIIDFLANFTHVAYLNLNVNKNLLLVFEGLLDIYCQVE